jgi:hypothetical protein
MHSKKLLNFIIFCESIVIYLFCRLQQYKLVEMKFLPLQRYIQDLLPYISLHSTFPLHELFNFSSYSWWNFNKGLKIWKFYLIWFKVESLERSKIFTTVKESMNLTVLFGLYDVWIWYFDVSLSCFLTWSCSKLFGPWYVIIFTIIILKPGSWVRHFHNIGWILELRQTVGVTTVQLNELHCDY